MKIKAKTLLLSWGMLAIVHSVVYALVEVETHAAPVEGACSVLDYPREGNSHFDPPYRETSGADQRLGSLTFSAEGGQLCRDACTEPVCGRHDFDIPDRLFMGPGDDSVEECVIAPDATGRYHSGPCNGECYFGEETEGYLFFNYDAIHPDKRCFAKDPARAKGCGSREDHWVAGMLLKISFGVDSRVASSVAPGVYLEGTGKFDGMAIDAVGECSDNRALCRGTDLSACGDPSTANCVRIANTPVVVYDWSADTLPDRTLDREEVDAIPITVFVPDVLLASDFVNRRRSGFTLGERNVGSAILRPSPGNVERGYSPAGDYDTSLDVDTRGEGTRMWANPVALGWRVIEAEMRTPSGSYVDFTDESPAIGYGIDTAQPCP